METNTDPCFGNQYQILAKCESCPSETKRCCLIEQLNRGSKNGRD